MGHIIITTKAFDDSLDAFVAELAAKRKDILDARKDTADFPLPTRDDIIDDIVYGIGLDEDNEYYNRWPVTENYDSDYPFWCRAEIEARNDGEYGDVIELYV